jgi:hypothetical protein
MKVYRATLESASPYSQSKHYEVDKLNKESAGDYEKRTWRERLHVNNDGYVFIPPMAFKNCLSDCAKYLSVQIPGKGKATYTKHFEAGVLVVDPLVLPIKKDKVDFEDVFVPSNGQRGGTTRVNKRFPIIHEWSGAVDFHVFDETITKEVFTDHITQAGQFIGIGRWRPRNNGLYGRFKVVSVKAV